MAILPCRHPVCVRCLDEMHRKSEVPTKDDDGNEFYSAFKCSLCNQMLEQGTLEHLASHLVTSSDSLRGLSAELQACTACAASQAAPQLLREHRFDVAATEEALFERCQALYRLGLWRREGMTPEGRQQIFVEVQRPVEAARQRLAEARSAPPPLRTAEREAIRAAEDALRRAAHRRALLLTDTRSAKLTRWAKLT